MDNDFEQDFKCCFMCDTSVALLRVRRAATNHAFVFAYGVCTSILYYLLHAGTQFLYLIYY